MNNEILEYTILFVEDEIELRDNYITYLKKHFIEVYKAANGEEAFNIYKERKPDILIIDINIPKINGLELLSKIRESDHSTKAIMLTAYSNLDYLLEATELKLTKYLVKPISRSELKDALDLVIKEISSFTTISNELINLRDGYIWNIDIKELFQYNNIITLTLKEKRLLELFISNVNKVISYYEIMIYVWEEVEDVTIESVKTLIKNLRKKLPKEVITNIYGEGYKFIN